MSLTLGWSNINLNSTISYNIFINDSSAYVLNWFQGELIEYNNVTGIIDNSYNISDNTPDCITINNSGNIIIGYINIH